MNYQQRKLKAKKQAVAASTASWKERALKAEARVEELEEILKEYEWTPPGISVTVGAEPAAAVLGQ